MKEIGELFKEKRESIGITEQEAAKDLDITIPQLENLEDGNVNAFKDIFFLKELIKKYAVYLNVDEDEVMENFNDFVFDFTSKIPVEEIEQKVKEIEKENDKETRKSIITIILVSFTLIILNIVLGERKTINKYMEGEYLYEFTE